MVAQQRRKVSKAKEQTRWHTTCCLQSKPQAQIVRAPGCEGKTGGGDMPNLKVLLSVTVSGWV